MGVQFPLGAPGRVAQLAEHPADHYVGLLAQLVEQLPLKESVPSSSLGQLTIWWRDGSEFDSLRAHTLMCLGRCDRINPIYVTTRRFRTRKKISANSS